MEFDAAHITYKFFQGTDTDALSLSTSALALSASFLWVSHPQPVPHDHALFSFPEQFLSSLTY